MNNYVFNGLQRYKNGFKWAKEAKNRFLRLIPAFLQRKEGITDRIAPSLFL